MVIKRVKVVHQFLVIIYRDIGLHFLHTLDFIFVAYQLLLDLFVHPLKSLYLLVLLTFSLRFTASIRFGNQACQRLFNQLNRFLIG